MFEYGIYVESGFLKNEAGLQYLQEAIDKQGFNREGNILLKLTGFKEEENKAVGEVMTRIEVETDWGVVPHVCDTVVKTFNMRKRWLKNK